MPDGEAKDFMNERERKLLIAFISVAVVGLGARYGRTLLLDPLLNSDKMVADAQGDLDAIQTEYDDYEATLRKKYDTFVIRTKSARPDEVRDDLYDCISNLVLKSKLKKAKITPKVPDIDKRSKVATIRISITAEGRFRQCVDFIQRFYKIPYIARFNSIKLNPTSARQKQGHDEVKFDGEIEVLVLPEEKLFDAPKGAQPKTIKGKYVEAKLLTKVKSWKPFTPYQKKTPPPTPTTKPRTPWPSPTPTPDMGPPSWDDGSQWVLRMVMRYGVDEVRLTNTADDSTIHIAVGEEFDGGELILVSALGVVSFKEDYGYYVYPLGTRVSDAIPLGEADDWPEIQVAMIGYFKDEDRRIEKEIAKAKQQADAWDDTLGPPAEFDGTNGANTGLIIAGSAAGLEDTGSNGKRIEESPGSNMDTNSIGDDATSSGFASSVGFAEELKHKSQPIRARRVEPHVGEAVKAKPLGRGQRESMEAIRKLKNSRKTSNKSTPQTKQGSEKKHPKE